jgi:hypothetical protein
MGPADVGGPQRRCCCRGQLPARDGGPQGAGPRRGGRPTGPSANDYKPGPVLFVDDDPLKTNLDGDPP